MDSPPLIFSPHSRSQVSALWRLDRWLRLLVTQLIDSEHQWISTRTFQLTASLNLRQPQPKRIQNSIVCSAPHQATLNPHWLLGADGFTIFELLITLLFSGILYSALAHALASTGEFKRRVDSELLVGRVESLLAAELSRITFEYDSHPFELLPRVQEAGMLRYSDGSANPVMAGSPRLRPKPGSTAISVIVPAFQFALRIDRERSDTSNLIACEFREPISSFLEFRTVMAVGIDGMWQAIYTALPHSDYPGCYTIKLSTTRGSILSALPSEAIPTIRWLVPIASEYSIYLASAGELRYLGQAGEQNIENQPITSGVEQFDASLPAMPIPNHTAITLRAVVKDRVVTKTAFSRFSKESYVDLLLNVK